ncbi:ABC transporter substrate-binding protein [Halorussus halophilus]|uniref:ABC transporter substrate-binding protein n=1 Tax=Halorussus halophilus TaxID=2650975 RepID=UPI0013013EBD|nr:ABC transporter substrate-binding protein [Halorussus halophilus]
MTKPGEANPTETNRRATLKIGATLGAVGLTGLAGCSGNNSSQDGTSSGGTTAGDDTESSTETTPDSLPRGGTFKIGAQQGIQTMNPFKGFLADLLTGEVMYDRLTRVDQDFKVHPNLAKEWEHNDDYTKWTFKLQENATFANLDGQTATASDVKATYEYLTSEEFSGSASSLGDVEQVKAVDDKTVEITLANSDIDFPKRIAETGGAFFVVPKKILDDDPKKLENTDYGTGQLTLTNWNQKNKLTFEAKSDYHRKGVDDKPLPYFDKLEWDILSDEIQRVNALSDGSIDAVSRISSKVKKRVPNSAKVEKQASGLQFPIVLDTKIKPFDDPKVRKAIKYALDRKQIVTAVSGEGVLGHHSGITPAHTYYNDNLPVDDTFGKTAKPKKAKQLLKEAGHAGGFEVKTFHYDDGVPAKETIAQLFQQQMRNVGIEFEIKKLTEEKWLADYWNKDGEWYITNYSTRVLGETVLQLALRSEGPWNEANWSNKKFDEAFNKAVTATDGETKAKNLKKCQEINHREGAWVGTYHPTIYGAHKNYVKNYDFYPTYVKDFVTQCAVDK